MGGGEITVEFVIEASATIAENKVNGLEDSTGSKMIKQLPQEKLDEIKRCFQDRLMELEDTTSSWKIVKVIFSRRTR